MVFPTLNFKATLLSRAHDKVCVFVCVCITKNSTIEYNNNDNNTLLIGFC